DVLCLLNDSRCCVHSLRRSNDGRWSRVSSCSVGFERVSQDCGNDRSILRVEIDDARARIGAANGIVAKEIEYWSVRKTRRAKIQCGQAGVRGVNAVAKLAYVTETMVNYLCACCRRRSSWFCRSAAPTLSST